MSHSPVNSRAGRLASGANSPTPGDAASPKPKPPRTSPFSPHALHASRAPSPPRRGLGAARRPQSPKKPATPTAGGSPASPYSPKLALPAKPLACPSPKGTPTSRAVQLYPSLCQPSPEGSPAGWKPCNSPRVPPKSSRPPQSTVRSPLFPAAAPLPKVPAVSKRITSEAVHRPERRNTEVHGTTPRQFSEQILCSPASSPIIRTKLSPLDTEAIQSSSTAWIPQVLSPDYVLPSVDSFFSTGSVSSLSFSRRASEVEDTSSVIFRCLVKGCNTIPKRGDIVCRQCKEVLSPICVRCRTLVTRPMCRRCGAITRKWGPVQTVHTRLLYGAPWELLAQVLQFAAHSVDALRPLTLVCREWLRVIKFDNHLHCCLIHLRLHDQDLQLGRRIATASYGIVRAGYHRTTKELYAVKSIDAAMGWDRTIVHTLSPFTVPCHNILTPLKIWIEGEEHSYLPTNQALMVVEEYCDRGSLLELAQLDQSIPETILAGLAQQMCAALAFLHQGGWRSRTKRSYDLTPADFLLTSGGTLKITAAPVAKSAECPLSPEMNKIYLAPEVIKGQKWAKAADSWTLGLIVLELALGHYPFQAVSVMQLIHEITTYRAIQFPLHLSHSALDFLVCCVGPEPQQRKSMADLLRRPWLHTAAAEAEIGHWLQSITIKPGHRTTSTSASFLRIPILDGC